MLVVGVKFNMPSELQVLHLLNEFVSTTGPAKVFYWTGKVFILTGKVFYLTGKVFCSVVASFSSLYHDTSHGWGEHVASS